MRSVSHLLVVLIVLMKVVGCGTSVDTKQLEADRFTLFSIDGNRYPPDDERAPAADVERFHGWPVLGKADITDPADRRQLLEAMQKGIDDNDGSVAGCFIPRHAIQIVTGDTTMDYVICFQCLQISTYETKAGNTTKGYKLTTAGPQGVFNAQLRKAGLPLAN